MTADPSGDGGAPLGPLLPGPPKLLFLDSSVNSARERMADSQVAGCGTAAILSAPRTPTMLTDSVGVGLSMMRSKVVLLRRVLTSPKITVMEEGEIWKNACVQSLFTARKIPRVVTASS